MLPIVGVFEIKPVLQRYAVGSKPHTLGLPAFLKDSLNEPRESNDSALTQNYRLIMGLLLNLIALVFASGSAAHKVDAVQLLYCSLRTF